MDLRGKRVVVTGASSGIGYLLAKRLIDAGARVIGVGRSAESLRQKFGSRIHTIVCDVSDPAQIDAMIEEAEQVLGGIDIFVSNAGFAYYGPIGAPDWQKDSYIFATNVTAPIYILQKLTYQRRRPLVFMLTISGLGKMLLPGFSIYCSTKFALDGFIRAYRLEKPAHVKVIPVYPVATFTDFWRRAGGKDTPMPFPWHPAGYVAWCMEMALRLGLPSVYPSPIYIIRCLLVRVLPVDLGVQAVELLRFKAWRRRHDQ